MKTEKVNGKKENKTLMWLFLITSNQHHESYLVQTYLVAFDSIPIQETSFQVVHQERVGRQIVDIV